MTFPEATRLPPLVRLLLIGLLLAVFHSAPARAQSEDGAQAWLLTYGPGEIYWQRFGHNAIWIRDPERGIDHTFNFGFFDFTQENFLQNFIQGRLNYFVAARPAQVELGEYVNENRSIRAQRLSLDAAQFARLRDYLLNEASPGNREYLYDYYRHNCSTRVRDALDLVLDGALRGQQGDVPARFNFRDHTRRLTEMDFFYYLGLQTGLGSPVDLPVSRWDEFFIPGVLADAVAELHDPQTGESLVIEDTFLYVSTLEPPADSVPLAWHRYLVAAALLLLAGWLLCRLPGIKAGRLALTWYSLAGTAGVVLFYLWFFTDHWAAGQNLNLLLLNPLWLVVVLVPALRKPGAWLVIACGLLALFAPWLPPGQYTADVTALALPLNVAASLILLRSAAQLGK